MCLPYRSPDQEAERRFPNWARFRRYERYIKRFRLFLGFGVLMEEEETGATIGLMSDSG
jgi:hypothetical protein